MVKTNTEIDKDLEDVFGSFLPQDYTIPSSGGNYMKFEEGDNKFRVLQNPIVGWELWVGKKPKRYPMGVSIPMEDAENADIDERSGEPRPAKHFWAMVVYNYLAKKIQILEVTQKGIQTSLGALSKSKDWGNPMGYDLSVIKEGKGFETQYQVIPNPPKELSTEVKEAWDAQKDKINIAALFIGGDPFAGLV